MFCYQNNDYLTTVSGAQIIHEITKINSYLTDFEEEIPEQSERLIVVLGKCFSYDVSPNIW